MNAIEKHPISQSLKRWSKIIFEKVYYVGLQITIGLLILVSCSDKDTLDKPTVSYELARPQIDSFMVNKRFREAYTLAKDLLPETERMINVNSERSAFLYNILGVCAYEMKQYSESILWTKKELQVRQNTNSPTDKAVLTALDNLGNALFEEGRYNEALEIVHDIKDRRERKGEIKSNQYAVAVSNIGKIYSRLDRYKEAETYLLQSVLTFTQLPEPDTNQLVLTLTYLSTTYTRLDEFGKAVETANNAVMLAQKYLGEKHYLTASALRIQGSVFILTKNPKAEEVLQQSYELLQQYHSHDQFEVAAIKRTLGLLYMSQGKNALANQYYSESLETARRIYNEDNPGILIYLVDYGHFLVGIHEYSKASGLLREALLISDKTFGKDSPTAILPLKALIHLYESTGEQVQLNIAAERLREIQEKM